MSVIIEVSPNTFEETGAVEHISRLLICQLHIETSDCNNGSVPPLEILAISDNRTVSQCFSCIHLQISRKHLQRYTFFSFIRFLISFIAAKVKINHNPP